MWAGRLGAGAAAKLVANSTLFGVIGVLGEAVALARGAGLEDDAALAVLSATPVGPQVERRRAVLDGAEPDVWFMLSLARKDADLVVRMAEACGADVRVARTALSWLTDAERDDGGTRDYSSVLKRIARQFPRVMARPAPSKCTCASSRRAGGRDSRTTRRTGADPACTPAACGRSSRP